MRKIIAQSEKNVANRKLQGKIQPMTLGCVFPLSHKVQKSVAKEHFW